MKDNHKWSGKSNLIGTAGDKYHKTWAKYLRLFLDNYKKLGINYKYMTIQNEPTNGYAIPAFWQSLGWSPEHMRDFLAKDLIPELIENGYLSKNNKLDESSDSTSINLLILDDVRVWLPYRADKILDKSISTNSNYIKGIATHWYMNFLIGTRVLDQTHARHGENQFILGTEACHEKHPSLGTSSKLSEQWARGQKYSDDIISCLNHWQTGWIDWNLILDERGGPNWAKNMCDSPIIVVSEGTRKNVGESDKSNTFLIQPMFFHMLHFSKLLKKGCQVVKTNVTKHVPIYKSINVKMVSVINHENNTVVVTILNKDESDHLIYLEDLELELYLDRKSLTSLVFQT